MLVGDAKVVATFWGIKQEQSILVGPKLNKTQYVY